MKANMTLITEAASRKGKFCGACHNGKLAFKHVGNCDRCHTGSLSAAAKGFAAFAKSVPVRTSYGDGINWVELLNRGMIKPRHYLNMKSGDMPFDKVLSLDAEGNMIPPAIFPHKAHSDWLECNSCHPDIFNIKRKTTQHFSMSSILKGEFCGVCHLRVAFPMNDCRRCHPGMKEQQT
jgi:c(7)-type cytochrome triheme protein